MTATNWTKVLDTITPEIFNAYMQELTAEKSFFVQSGIAVPDERVSKQINMGGLLVNMPFWNDLANEDDEILGDGDKALTTSKITASKDVSAVHYRGKGWAVNEMAAVLSGDDPMKALMSRIAAWWVRREQALLMSTLKGLFATGGALRATHLLDRSTKILDGKTILDTKQLLGDSAERVNTLAMHSAVYTELQKQDLIEFLQTSTTDVKIPTYLDYRVVVDDGIKPDENGIYTTYLFGTGSLGRNAGNPSALTTFETDRDKAKGTDIIYTRRAMTLHPYGVRWMDTDTTENELTPSNADLEKPENWKKVYEDKNIAILAVKHLLVTP